MGETQLDDAVVSRMGLGFCCRKVGSQVHRSEDDAEPCPVLLKTVGQLDIEHCRCFTSTKTRHRRGRSLGKRSSGQVLANGILDVRLNPAKSFFSHDLTTTSCVQDAMAMGLARHQVQRRLHSDGLGIQPFGN